MTMFNCRLGLFSMLLVLVGSLTGHAAPLADREGFTRSQETKDVLSTCKDRGMSTDPGSIRSWENTCRPTYSTNYHIADSLQRYQQNVVREDRFSHTQLMIHELIPSFSGTKSEISEINSDYNTMRIPWMNAVVGIGAVTKMFHSLYEFVLPEQHIQKDSLHGEQHSYPSRQLRQSRGTVLLNWSRKNNAPQMPSILQILGIQDHGIRNVTFWDSNYQLEVSDTLTKFIPNATLPTRSLAVEDVMAFILLLLLLPDYQRLRALFSHGWKYDRWGYPHRHTTKN